MDPDAAWARICELKRRHAERGLDEDEARELADWQENLARWVRIGGRRPRAWGGKDRRLGA